MKLNLKIFFAIIIAASTLQLKAQGVQQVEKVFSRFLNDPQVSHSVSIQVDRKPGADVTGKTSQCEIHSFAIHKPDKKGRYKFAERGRQYVTDLENAIQALASHKNCYRIASYHYPSTSQPRQWNLLYGDDASQYVTLGKQRGKNYIFACIADENNPGYRTCYALEWYEQYSGTNKVSDIFGQYMVLYAKMPEQTSSEPQYQATVKYGYQEDPFSFLNSGKYGLGLTINAEDRTFTLNGETLPLDSLTSAFAKGRGMTQLEAALQTGNVINLLESSKAKRVANFMKGFNALRAQWREGGYKTDSTLPVSIYILVKDAVDADLLSSDEKELVNSQLVSMVKETEPGYEDTCAYLALTQKILGSGKN